MILRPWRNEDYAPYAALNADPEVRRYFPATLNREESDAQAAGLQKHIEKYGFGFWAAEVPGIARFIGFVGLKQVGPDLPFAPAAVTGMEVKALNGLTVLEPEAKAGEPKKTETPPPTPGPN